MSYEIPTWEESAPFWEAALEERLTLLWCQACEKSIHFPRVICPRCLGERLEWRDATGRATVHAFSIAHGRAPKRMGDVDRFVVALVDLDEGARMMTNIVGCDPESVHVGQRVTVAWEASGDVNDRMLPVFRPEENEP